MQRLRTGFNDTFLMLIRRSFICLFISLSLDESKFLLNLSNYVNRFFPFLGCQKTKPTLNVLSHSRLFFSIVRGYKMHIDEFLPFIVPISMYIFGGNHTFLQALKMFFIVIVSGSFIFSIIGINAGHHHDEIVHDGDPVR